MIWGLDVLGAAKYQRVVTKTVPKDWCVGIFWEEFGPAKKLIKRLAQQEYKYIRIQGLWDSAHQYPTAKDSQVFKIAHKIQKLAVRYPGTKFYFSPFCEHRQRRSRMEILFGRIAAIAPNLTLVNSPIRGGDYVTSALNEIHHHDTPGGNPGKDYIFSYDGLACTNSDVEKMKAKHSKASMFFFWVPQFNCKPNMKPKKDEPLNRIPPKLRKLKPTGNQIKAVIYLANPKSIDTIDKKWQYKSDSEQSAVVDPRASKPVLLGPVKGDAHLRRGSKKFKLVYSGTEHGGDHVYRRLNSFGYELAGKPRVVEVFVNGISVGSIDPGFRSSKRFIE